MERYFKRKSVGESSSPKSQKKTKDGSTSRQPSEEVILERLPADPGLRKSILSYHPNIRDHVRRAYLLKGPCQPRSSQFPCKNYGIKPRRFLGSWFSQFPNWLEYSIEKDALFCLCCYLFKPYNGDQSGGDTFVGVGFSNWKKKERLLKHVGASNSSHNKAWQNSVALLNQNQHIETIINKQSDQDHIDYRIRLGASVDVCRILLKQGLPFRGHDESQSSFNKGNFLEFLEWLRGFNKDIKAVTLDKAPENMKLTSPDIQKDIANSISVEIIDAITREMDNSVFAILVDESRDVSTKEQMAIVIRYVNKGRIIERFVGIEHVPNTKACTLKEVIDDFFSRHNGLSISRLRGQGYDGASNMQGEFNGLKKLIQDENKSAYYIHCFAHQLQLALVAVAKKHSEIADLFTMVSSVVTIVGSSAKRKDILREKHSVEVLEALENDEIFSGQGLNQETNLKRASDTRWSSQYDCLIRMIQMFKSVIEVLCIVREDGLGEKQKFEAKVLLTFMQSFNFTFGLHLMKKILGMTNELSKALQKKDQDIVNAMKLVRTLKERLQHMRDSGWESLLDQVSSFCVKHHIEVPNMEEIYSGVGKSSRKAQPITNFHHYRVDLFSRVIDIQLIELNDRFNEENTELLLCVACLSPSNSFAAFDKERLVRLAQFYRKDFSEYDTLLLEGQLENYIWDVKSDTEFANLNGISDLAQKMVEKKKDEIYPLVYLLLTLALVLPVATASVERVFSAMNIVKTRLRNRIGDVWMNDCLVAYIEKDIFHSLDNEVIMQRFQKMKARRGVLSKCIEDVSV